MDLLFDAIRSKFTTAGLASTITGGMHFSIAKQGAVMPFLVVTPITAPLVDSYGNTTHYDCTVQFALFGETTVKALMLLVPAILTAYDNVVLTITGKTNIDCYRIDEPMPILQGSEQTQIRSESTKNVWGVFWTYRYSVQ